MLYEARLFPELEYTFKHALTHEVAYNSILADRRRALHTAIVDAGERLYASRLAEHVEMLAHHAARGGMSDKAVKYLREAGTRAAARSANREAVDYLEHALAIVEEGAQTNATMSEALDIRIALGTSLIALYGPSDAPVERNYRKALDLVERLGDDARRFLVLWALWYIRFTTGDYRPAIEAAERLLDVAKGGDDVSRHLEALHSVWPTLIAMGELSQAMPHMERGIALYDPSQHASLIHLYGGHDPGVCGRYYLGLTQWLLGRPDEAVPTIQEAVRLAERLKHPLSTLMALWFLALVQHERGDRASAAVIAERVIGLADAHGYLAWRDDLVPLLHEARGDRVSIEDLRELEARLARTRATRFRRVLGEGVLARLYGHIDRPDEGLRLLNAQVGDAGFWTAEVHRLKGELMLRIDPATVDGAESCFNQALADARSRREKSLELRAAMSLYRLRRRLGHDKPARRALADLYSSFTEGFATADLIAAKVPGRGTRQRSLCHPRRARAGRAHRDQRRTR
jgi:tetratricopeptide (TPR) repeat protein